MAGRALPITTAEEGVMKSYKTRVAASLLTAVLCLPAFAATIQREEPRRDLTARLVSLVHKIQILIGVTVQDEAPVPPRP
jgi:hypothetical protein